MAGAVFSPFFQTQPSSLPDTQTIVLSANIHPVTSQTLEKDNKTTSTRCSSAWTAHFASEKVLDLARNVLNRNTAHLKYLLWVINVFQTFEVYHEICQLAATHLAKKLKSLLGFT